MLIPVHDQSMTCTYITHVEFLVPNSSGYCIS